MRFRWRFTAVMLAALLAPGGAPIATVLAGHASPTVRADGPWDYAYGISHTDGLYLQSVQFNSKLVLAKISLVQIEVEYTEPGGSTIVLYDELGTGTAAGATLYPPSGGTAFTTLADGGIKLSQEFKMPGYSSTSSCDYRYMMEYQLHGNGDIMPWVTAFGPGCLQTNYTARYHFFFRADFDIRGASNDKFAHWHTSSWEVPATEAANPHHDDYNNRFGQYNGPEWQTWEPAAPVSTYNFDPYTYDTTELWILRFNEGTGGVGQDLAARTSPGLAWHFPPDLWSNSESVQNADLVHWYVIHATRLPGYGNGTCWPTNPCVRGPDKFNPTGDW